MSTELKHEANYHREEIELWLSKIDARQVAEFCLQHRVEVLFQSDQQFHCFVDYKDDKQSHVYAVALTSFGALYQGIYEFLRRHKS